MGKRILQQRKGKGTKRFISVKKLKIGDVKHPSIDMMEPEKIQSGRIIDFVKEPSRGAPLAILELDNGRRHLWLPPEGVFVGDVVEFGPKTELKIGNTMEVGNLPEGTIVYNVEKLPRDGGRYVKAAGASATVLTRSDRGVNLTLPSGKTITVHQKSRATIGIVAGGGRVQRPFISAGSKYYYMKHKSAIWPHVGGVKMNAVCHPFGGGRKKNPGKSSTTSRNAPPGRKVGLIAAKRSGRKKK